MTEFMSAEALARLAAAGDPQVRLMLALAALGADQTQNPWRQVHHAPR
ncbi:hypothetical protein AB0D94_08165 [Streptomyces sp. NPDC048255]